MAVEDDSLILPPGFRFHPTDEEIITHYLSPKVLNHGFIARAMGEVDLNKCEPWDLPSKAKMGEKEWYFFCQRDRKYPTGMRTNRATESGYWKATGKDKEIYRGRVLVGMKKTLVFYRGRAPKGEKTNWVMHEYRLEGKVTLSNLPRSAKEEWVVCRVFHKNTGMKRSPMHRALTSFTEELLDSPRLPPLMDSSGNYFFNSDEDCYFSSSGVLDNSNLFMNNIPSSSSSYLHQIHAEDNYNNNQYFSVPGDVGCYLHQDQPQVMMMQSATIPAIRRHCKAEQFSNQSMLSQDTGVSNDRNTEISSVVSKRDASFDQEFDVPSEAAAGVLDLRGMWRC